MYAHEDFIIHVIMHCRTPESCKFKRSLEFKLHHAFNCKQRAVLKSIEDAFGGEHIPTQYSVLATKLIFIFMSINKLIY